MTAATMARRLPGIDLHLHLEGSLPRRTLAALAARHRLSVPSLSGFRDLRGFLKAFARVCDLLSDEEDFRMAASAVFAEARRQRVAHLEVRFSPQVFTRRGIPLSRIMAGLAAARRSALAAGGMTILYVLDGVRQWGGDWLEEMVRAIEPWAGEEVRAIGLGGDETSRPAAEFRRAFLRARRMGLCATVHAGEAAGPESVRDAIEFLEADRIGHGVAAALDPGLMRLLARRRIALEVCPTSNVMTSAVRSLRDHPLRTLLAAGVPVTINSDDGAFFRTDVRREMSRSIRAFDLSRSEVVALASNAARAAFLPRRGQRALQLRIDRFA